MKTRQGFVSNSSSSSFVIIVEDTKPDGYFNILDILKLMCHKYDIKNIDANKIEFKEKNPKQTYGNFIVEDINDFVNNSNITLEIFEKELNKLKEKYSCCEKLSKESDEILKLAMSIDKNYNPNVSLEDVREDFISKMFNLEIDIKEKDKEIKKLKTEIETVKRFKNKKIVIVKFVVDDWDKEKMLDLLKKSNTQILECKHIS
jgi:hypothetical protein